MKKLLDRDFIETSKSTMANVAVFYDENDVMLYSGIIREWPIIIATDEEWRSVQELDTRRRRSQVRR
jgi:hypothetical protein